MLARLGHERKSCHWKYPPGLSIRGGRSDSRYQRESTKPLACPELHNAHKRHQRAAWLERWTRVRARPGATNWPTVVATVLHPFGGADTVGLGDDRLDHDSILVRINPDYVDLARRRIGEDGPLLTQPKAIECVV